VFDPSGLGIDLLMLEVADDTTLPSWLNTMKRVPVVP